MNKYNYRGIEYLANQNIKLYFSNLLREILNYYEINYMIIYTLLQFFDWW